MGNEKKLGIKLSDLAVHPTTDQVYGVNNDNCVYKYGKGLLFGFKFSIVFKTELRPWCLAVLKDGHVVIGFFHDHIVRVYSEDGTISIERSHICLPKHWGYSGLCVVDQKLVTKYKYGETCTDAVFDLFGHLLLVSGFKGVRVLNADTWKHLKTINISTFGNTDLVSSLTISDNGQLVVGTYKQNKLCLLNI